MPAERLAILAGGGAVPQQLIDHLRGKGQNPLVIAFHGETGDLRVADQDLYWMKVGTVSGIVNLLEKENIHQVVMVGKFKRPDFKNLKLDLAGAALLPKIIKAAAVGDDALLRVIVDYLEQKGFQVCGADSVFSDLSPPIGPLTVREPDAGEFQDIQRGIEIAKSLGRFDIGQGAVIRNGYVLAVEAAEGTDRMLARCRDFAGPSAAGILVKCAKPQQDTRVDLPTIGPLTVQNAVAASLKGIAIEARASLIADRQATIDLANKHNLFIYAFGGAAD